MLLSFWAVCPFRTFRQLGNSARQKQTLSSVPWVLSRTPSAPTTLSRSLLSLPTTQSTYTLPFFRCNPSSTLYECARNDVAAWAARAPRSIDIKWSMRHSSKMYEKNCCVPSCWHTSMIRRVVVRLRNKIESLFNWVRRLWEETIRIFNIVWIWTSGLLRSRVITYIF